MNTTQNILQNESYEITKQNLSYILQYLDTRPHGEVRSLCDALLIMINDQNKVKGDVKADIKLAEKKIKK